MHVGDQPHEPSDAVTASNANDATPQGQPQATNGHGGVANRAQRPSAQELRQWLRAWVKRTTELSDEEIRDDAPMQSFGLSSRDVVQLSGELEEHLGVRLDATIAYEHPTIAALSQHLSETPDEHQEQRSQQRGTRSGAALTPGEHDVAIVGMAARYPGASNLEEMWQLLVEGRDGLGEPPAGRWEEYANDEVTQRRMREYPMRGGYLEDIRTFDAEFFGLSPLEAQNIDPQQRIMLELSWEALEHAHIPASSLRGEPVGVFFGSSNNDYGMLIASDPANAHPYALTGTASSVIPNRVSYAFDFRGPSVSVDTACSSSLVATHQAVRALRDGEARVALAGGVNILATPFVSTAFGELGVFSPTGKIHAFSDDADGFVRSDGAGVLVLKRVADAIADGDSILAVIRGSAVNSDGHSNGITAPNPEAQVDVLERAYADAGVNPADVDYIEAHGTGTILGDPIEARALGRVLGAGRDAARPTLLGSAKTNFGHTESAAGAAGLVKTVLAIGNNVLPPSLHYTAPNRYVDFDAEHIEVVEDPREWPEYSGRKIAGVSGFGFGGTNAHVVVSAFDPDDYAEEAHSPAPQALLNDDAEVALPVSGLLPSRRKAAAADLAEAVAGLDAAALPALARSLARRNHGRSRAVVLAATPEEAAKRLGQVAEGKVSTGISVADAPAAAGPVFVYSGFGSQHRKMAKDLVEASPWFAARLRELDEIVRFEAGWSIMDIVADDALTYDTETAQVAITAIQIAVTDLLAEFGARPAAVMGMSMGEIAAAYAAGGLSAHDAMVVAAHRSRLMGEGERSLPEDQLGAMAVVEFSVEGLDAFIAEHPEFQGVEPAVYGGPGMTTVGGPRPAVTALVEHLEEEGKFARLLNVRGAGHTSAVEPLLGELAAECSGITPKPLSIPLLSSVERGRTYQPGEVVHGPDYWVRCTRQSVWFQDATEAAFAAGHTTLVEIAPNPVALMPMMNTAFATGHGNAQLLFALKRKVDAPSSIRQLLAKLYASGSPVDFAKLYGAGPVIPAPGIRWKRQDYWTAAKPQSGGRQLPGTKVTLPGKATAFGIAASEVTSTRALLEAAVQAVLPSARLTAFEEHEPVPSDAELTTMVQVHVGGAVATTYRVDGQTLVPIAEGFGAGVSGDSSASAFDASAASAVDAGSVSNAATQQAAGAGIAGAGIAGKNTEGSDAGLRWDATSGESVEQRLRSIVGESMGYDVEDLPGELPLIDLGLDSLMGMRIKNRVEHDFQIPPLEVQALRDASVADVVRMVEDLVAQRDAAPSEGKNTEGESQKALAASADHAAKAAAPNDASEDAASSAEATPPTAWEPPQPAAQQGVGVAPRDASERLVFATWAGMTGKAAAGVTSELPKISEEQAQAIAERLSDRAGTEVTAEQVLRAETLEPLASVVRQGLETDVEGNIRVLRARPEGSTAPAVFMFHPAGGSSVVYQPLTRRLPEDVPVYGVERLEGSLEERVAAYLDEIERYADGFPVILGGWSFGGALAYEAAYQLRQRDVSVSTIALLDTVRPAHPAPDTKEETKKRWERYSAFAKKTYGLDFPVPYDLLESAGEQALLGMMSEFLAHTDASEHGLSAGVLEHQRASFVDNRILDTMELERWAEVEVPVMLFRAERMHEGAIELEPAYAEIDPDGGWGVIVKDLEIIQLHGDHLAVVDEPEIGTVGKALTGRIASMR